MKHIELLYCKVYEIIPVSFRHSKNTPVCIKLIELLYHVFNVKYMKVFLLGIQILDTQKTDCLANTSSTGHSKKSV